MIVISELLYQCKMTVNISSLIDNNLFEDESADIALYREQSADRMVHREPTADLEMADWNEDIYYQFTDELDDWVSCGNKMNIRK